MHYSMTTSLVRSVLYLRADVLGAEKILAKGSSGFHKTGHSAVSFLRALIGFESEMLREGECP